MAPAAQHRGPVICVVNDSHVLSVYNIQNVPSIQCRANGHHSRPRRPGIRGPSQTPCIFASN